MRLSSLALLASVLLLSACDKTSAGGKDAAPPADLSTGSNSVDLLPQGADLLESPDLSATADLAGASDDLAVAEGDLATSGDLTSSGDLASEAMLSIVLDGNGAGSVTSLPTAIDCGSGTMCSSAFSSGATVTLFANASSGSEFLGWSGGGCTGTNFSCTVTMSSDQEVTATFGLKKYTVTIDKTGSGTVSGNGLDCGATCTLQLEHGTSISLTATPDAEFTFGGFGGPCTGGGCNFTLTSDVTISALFSQNDPTLLITVVGAGGVFSSAAGISCVGPTCSKTFAPNTVVTLIADPTSSTTTVFAGWTGECAGTESCVVTLDRSKNVTATFATRQFPLTVSTVGSGVVSGSAVGISCGAQCVAPINYNTWVDLTAIPGPGQRFVGWSGDVQSNYCNTGTLCQVRVLAARNVAATFEPDEFVLTVTKAGTAATTGTVTADSGALKCGAQCSGSYTRNTSVKLTASGEPGTVFTGWSYPGCNGVGPCTVSVSQATSVTATFKRQYQLTVSKQGLGTGTVGTENVAGIYCDTDCSEFYDVGTSVKLVASVQFGSGSVFAGWSGGGCSGTGACFVTMDAAKDVVAQFDITSHAVTAEVIGAGPGTGNIYSDSGIDCGTDCGTSLIHGQDITFVATPAPTYYFVGWVAPILNGPCDGSTNPTCTLTINSDTHLRASFAQRYWALDLSKAGTGTGTVTSSPGGINCNAFCASGSNNFLDGTLVTLTATPSANHVFAGWSGTGVNCSGTEPCTVLMSQARAVTATFNIAQRALQVTKSGTGTGTVVATNNGSPAGINCGGDCSESYPHGIALGVVLTPTPDPGFVFAGWTINGSLATCPSTVCTLPMTADVFATARFEPTTMALNVTKAGSGTGTVSTLTAGINCGSTCSKDYAYGSSPQLNASPDVGSKFSGWAGGGCSGTGSCTVTMDEVRNVTAYFEPSGAATMPLGILKAGNGSGTVTATGINCGGDCAELYALNAVVPLTATPDPGSYLDSWSGGGCAGAGACSVTMSAATQVTATFKKSPSLLTINKTGAGKVSGTGIDCGGDCSEAVAYGDTVALTATPDPGQSFLGWGGPCSGTGACSVQVTAAVEVTAIFSTNNYVVSITRSGAGTGSIGSDPAGINCPSTFCSNTFAYGTVVTLTATPGTGATFDGWTGAGCSGTGTCQFTVTGPTTIDAAFGDTNFTLTTSTDGDGTGSIASTPAGIACPGDCSQSYVFGTFVELAATPDADSDFTGWSIAECPPIDTCVVEINASRSVKATFTKRKHLLTVEASGTGAGTIGSAAGIDCGDDCFESIVEGSTVTLVATAATGSTFTGWSLASCPGTGNCQVTMDQAKHIAATFTLNNYTVTVTRAGATGSNLAVLSTVPGVDGTFLVCGSQCVKSFQYGSIVTLYPNAVANNVDAFVGWSGEGCSGTGPCILSATQNRTVTATFASLNRVFVTSSKHTGNLGGLAGADAICQARAAEAGLSGTYKAWLSTATTSAASRLGAARGWVSTAGTPVLDRVADLAIDNVMYPPSVDERGSYQVSTDVQTGTAPNGTFDTGAESSSCSDWTSAAPSQKRLIGSVTANSSLLTSMGYASCDQPRRLYCFGVDNTTPLAYPNQFSGRRAFTSTADFNPATGLAGADALCQAEATSASLPGTYRALLATSTSSALSRFDIVNNQTGWTRVDGIPVATPAIFQFFTSLTSAPNVNAAKTLHFGNAPIFTGSGNLQGPGTLASTCNDWTTSSAGNNATVGLAGDARQDRWLSSLGSASCNTPRRIVCMQE